MPQVEDYQSNLKTDPLKNFKFLVEVKHPNPPPNTPSLKMGFMSASGLAVATEVIPYREGGMNTSFRKMPGQSSYSDLQLQRGVIAGGHQMWMWFKQIFFLSSGKGYLSAGQDFRANISIHVLDHPVTRGDSPSRMVFNLFNAWPSSLSYSDLDAGGNAVLIQTITLTHEGWDQHGPSQPGDDYYTRGQWGR